MWTWFQRNTPLRGPVLFTARTPETRSLLHHYGWSVGGLSRRDRLEDMEYKAARFQEASDGSLCRFEKIDALEATIVQEYARLNGISDDKPQRLLLIAAEIDALSEEEFARYLHQFRSETIAGWEGAGTSGVIPRYIQYVTGIDSHWCFLTVDVAYLKNEEGRLYVPLPRWAVAVNQMTTNPYYPRGAPVLAGWLRARLPIDGGFE